MWMKRCAALAVAAVIGVAASSPAHATSDPSRDAPLRTEIRNLVDVDGVPGVAAVTSHDGRPVRRMAAGLADIPAGRAMRPDDRFRIASITKSRFWRLLRIGDGEDCWEEGGPTQRLSRRQIVDHGRPCLVWMSATAV